MLPDLSSEPIQYPIELDGVVTRVLEAGEGDDVVICLHGAGSRADRWRPQLPRLAAAGFHVYAIDFPGHGLAARPAGYRFGTPAFSRVVHELIDTIGAPAVSLMGTSLGGHVAARVACDRPDRVRATVLIGAVGLVPTDGPSSGTAAPIADSSPSGTRAKFELLVHDQRLATDELVREESMVNSSPGSADARAELGRYLVEDLDRELVGSEYAALDIPTMLLWGAEDRWIPTSVGERSAEVIAHAQYVTLARTGHAPYFERPIEFFDVVHPFLDTYRMVVDISRNISHS